MVSRQVEEDNVAQIAIDVEEERRRQDREAEVKISEELVQRHSLSVSKALTDAVFVIHSGIGVLGGTCC